jgi:two-component system phosphate regulon sensor histidine kinase PhoR
MHAVALPATGGAACVAVFHDVSELRRLDRVRRDFLANASHELRTPLTSIQGFASTLLETPLEGPERRNYLEVIARNAERLSSLIDDLLELSQIEGRREPLRRDEVEVVDVASRLLEDLAPRLEQHSLNASLGGDASARAFGDRRAIEQVLSNLLDNAVKYSDEGGTIDVTIDERSDRVEVTVADSGIGIPAADLDRVFERFYRVDKARSRALGGTGLGLSIVKHLVQGMGGDIRVASQLGKGSTFRFWLPGRPADSASS